MTRIPVFDRDRLIAFENSLDPTRPEQGAIPAKVLGYGEVSSTFAISGIEGVAFKRMPPFPQAEARAGYTASIRHYSDILREAGIPVVGVDFVLCTNKDNEAIVYVVQPLLQAVDIGNQRLRRGNEAGLERMLRALLPPVFTLWRRNRKLGSREQVGLDAQLSNWVLTDQEDGSLSLGYLDITTPMLRLNGVEQLDIEIFLKSIPFFLVTLVRRFFLQDVLNRYYDLRQVLVDIVANLYKEGFAELIPTALATINSELTGTAADLQIAPLNAEEIARYYREDKFIWAFLLWCRRLDRFIKKRLLRRKYNFILPGVIKR